jgi:23S rRNA G2069 N7-methylase RlmK/C1962 C5-methylase RlmI
MKTETINNLIKNGQLSRYFQTYLLSKELNLKVLPVDKNGTIFGSTDFAEIVDTVTKRFKIKIMLDLFSGSGALAKITLLNGTNKVICVDMFTKAIEINLSKYKSNVGIRKGDILKMKFDDFYDIVILDPPSILLTNVVKQVLPKLDTDLVIMYYGGKGNVKRDEKIENLCKKLFKETLIIQKHGLKHICCSSTKTGKKYLRYLQKKFR